MNYIPLTSVVIDQERLRKDMGDVYGLATSIRDHATDLVTTKGLMHPIVIDAENKLIAGGRRLTAFGLLHSGKIKDVTNPEFFESIPYTLVETLSPAKRRMLEIEENRRRHPMSWQEDVIGVCDFHRLAVKEAMRDGEKHSQAMTGDILGVTQASISIAIKLTKIMLAEPDSPIAKADGILKAIQLMAARELDIAAKEQLTRIDKRRVEAAKNIQLSTATVPIEVIEASRVTLPNQRPVDNVLTNDQIASFYYRGSALDLLPEIAKTQKINHIICDPPYGIDTKFMSGGDERRESLLARIKETHGVEDNLLLIPAFLQVAFDCIAEDGFLCMWYDLDHHEKIAQWATAIGWKVCRWPLTWCKTSPCLNQAAQYNITKATEVCYFMRRSEKAFIKQKQTKNYVLANSVSDATHPFTKPPEVWNYIIDTVSIEGENLCDPFAGQGSSLVQFFKKNRTPIGIEIDDVHIANGINYIANRIGKQDAPDINGLLSDLPL